MLLINKLSLSASSFNVYNNNSSSKRKRTPSMSSIAPLLQRIKKSFLNHHYNTEPNENNNSSTARRSNTVHCCLSEKQEFTSVDEKSILFSTEDTKYYALRLERSMNDQKYTQPVENWWSATPPIQQTNQHRSIMIC